MIEPDPDAADASKLGCLVEAIVRLSISIGTLLLALDAQDTQVRVKSMQTYNRAICEVAKALKGADWYQRDGLMATARLLSFYEVGLTGQQSGAKVLCMLWQADQRHHHRSWSRPPASLKCSPGEDTTKEPGPAMFLARGPYAFTSGAAHPLFIDARVDLA